MLNVQTDYAKIACRYDEDREKYHGQRDEYLAAFVAAHRHPPVKVLDLGCGSGLWLRDQVQFFKDRPVSFVGVEPSDEMRARAQEKLGPDVVRVGRAEAIPFEAGSFDLITSHFAFHHFTDKEAAIAEIARVVRPGGSFRLFNVAPEYSPNWWLYRYFPEAVALDALRFWKVAKIQNLFRDLGWQVATSIEPSTDRLTHQDAMHVAERRVTSQFAILSDVDYERGLKRLERDDEDFFGRGLVPSEMRLVTMVCTRTV